MSESKVPGRDQWCPRYSAGAGRAHLFLKYRVRLTRCRHFSKKKHHVMHGADSSPTPRASVLWGGGCGDGVNPVTPAVTSRRVCSTVHVTPPAGTDASSLTAMRMVDPCTS